ncbi:MAG: hypothetical protein IJ313_07955 [Clostridia bacterium]|nr:hypothetical protein [Clostridia bacterium]
MIKTLLRFSLLIVLCCLFVYAPEIFSAVSAPYLSAAPERVLLRIALCCDGETSDLLSKAISAYQKEYPSVHLRVTQVSDQQLSALPYPYPDVVVCPQPLAAQLPAVFTPAAGGQTLLCAVSPDSKAAQAAAQFAAYIDEALTPQTANPEI